MGMGVLQLPAKKSRRNEKMGENKDMTAFVAGAINNKKEEETKFKFNDAELFGAPRITIVGCGGAGGNTITRLKRLGVTGAKSTSCRRNSKKTWRSCNLYGLYSI